MRQSVPLRWDCDTVTLTTPRQIRFVGDIYGELTKAWDLEFDSAAVFGINRSKRAAIVTNDGKVVEVAIEPTNTQTDGQLTCATSVKRLADAWKQ